MAVLSGTADERGRFFWVWPATLACFVLAGLTGALYRFGLLYGLPAGLQLHNIRHAHSHLMYLGWVTPLLMALIASHLPDETDRPLPRGTGYVIGVTILLALASYPPFLMSGYEPVTLGDARLPLGAIVACFNILAWYVFVTFYLRVTRGVTRSRALRLWDVALGALVLASVGAWGRGLLMAVGSTDPFLAAASVHLFLDLFAEGWFVAGLLGVFYASVRWPASSTMSAWGTRLLVIGLPATVFLSVPASLTPEWLRWSAGIGGVLVATGLLLHVAVLWPQLPGPLARVPLAFLLLKATAELAGSMPAMMAWALDAGLRIPYLHVLLLGVITLGLFTAGTETWGADRVRGYRVMTAAVGVLLLTLLPLTGLWPASLAGRWALEIAAWAALGPTIVGLAILGRMGVGTWSLRADDRPASRFATRPRER